MRSRNAHTPAQVSLTPEEDASLHRISFDVYNSGQPDPDPLGDAASELMQRLLKRNAIPSVRLRYFGDPKLNIGGHGRSRMQGFERDGITGEAIFRDGNFIKYYLKYFIFGPDIPQESGVRLKSVVDNGLGSSGMILDQLC